MCLSLVPFCGSLRWWNQSSNPNSPNNEEIQTAACTYVAMRDRERTFILDQWTPRHINHCNVCSTVCSLRATTKEALRSALHWGQHPSWSGRRKQRGQGPCCRCVRCLFGYGPQIRRPCLRLLGVSGICATPTMGLKVSFSQTSIACAKNARQSITPCVVATDGFPTKKDPSHRKILHIKARCKAVTNMRGPHHSPNAWNRTPCTYIPITDLQLEE